VASLDGMVLSYLRADRLTVSSAQEWRTEAPRETA